MVVSMPSDRPRLTALIIARDEERDLPACLESLKGLADEIVLVDSHSQDRTREIAAAAGARVFERDWPGYGPQKQFALEQARGEWVLNLDADERATPELKEEVLSVIASPAAAAGYSIPFRLYFMGRRLRFGRGVRERHVRLFLREKSRYPAGEVHEGVRVDGPVGSLRGPVDHHSYRDFSEYLKKCDEYTGLIAARKRAAGARFSSWMHLRLPLEFFVRYAVKGGFLDGGAGFTYAALSAYYAWLKHARLMEERS
jgi:glycosyltransferase involved in cell wall biosynthesis